MLGIPYLDSIERTIMWSLVSSAFLRLINMLMLILLLSTLEHYESSIFNCIVEVLFNFINSYWHLENLLIAV